MAKRKARRQPSPDQSEELEAIEDEPQDHAYEHVEARRPRRQKAGVPAKRLSDEDERPGAAEHHPAATPAAKAVPRGGHVRQAAVKRSGPRAEGTVT